MEQKKLLTCASNVVYAVILARYSIPAGNRLPVSRKLQTLAWLVWLKAFQLGNQLLTLPLPGFKLYINFLFDFNSSCYHSTFAITWKNLSLSFGVFGQALVIFGIPRMIFGNLRTSSVIFRNLCTSSVIIGNLQASSVKFWQSSVMFGSLQKASNDLRFYNRWRDISYHSLVKWYRITSLMVWILFTALSHWYPHIISNKLFIYFQRFDTRSILRHRVSKILI